MKPKLQIDIRSQNPEIFKAPKLQSCRLAKRWIFLGRREDIHDTKDIKWRNYTLISMWHPCNRKGMVVISRYLLYLIFLSCCHPTHLWFLLGHMLLLHLELLHLRRSLATTPIVCVLFHHSSLLCSSFGLLLSYFTTKENDYEGIFEREMCSWAISTLFWSLNTQHIVLD